MSRKSMEKFFKIFLCLKMNWFSLYTDNGKGAIKFVTGWLLEELIDINMVDYIKLPV